MDKVIECTCVGSGRFWKELRCALRGYHAWREGTHPTTIKGQRHTDYWRCKDCGVEYRMVTWLGRRPIWETSEG